MKTDAQLKKDVSAELEWDPSINASQVGVAVKDGVVTLTGHLDTFAEKHAIERAAQRVRGVKAVAVELDVKLEPGHKRSDSEIAAAAEAALAWHALVPADRMQVRVEKGWVTLQGEVDWDYQRRQAEKAVRPLVGVVGVSNAIALKTGSTPADVTQRIRDALTRHAEHEAKHIEVIVDGATVTLRGDVDSWGERAAASGAAWSARGVSSVVNELKVKW
ncbi:BON domain-containing protein [Piscinibacter sp.]|jgi:osmotically-inducible protein OsmY|uniref:BON domain-containing protein n=1 Tax=Piscinibacter sp. TaxID=1903157 RepID=UPI00355A5ABA